MGTDFFVPARTFSVGDVAQLTGAELVDPSKAGLIISAVASAAEASAGSLVFVDGKRNGHLLVGLTATAVLCAANVADMVPPSVATLIHSNPLQAFAKVGREMFPEAAFPVGVTAETGISSNAYVHPEASVEEGATIEAGAVIGADVSVGSGTLVASNAVLGPHCRVGRGCYIGPNASLRYALLGDRVIVHAGAGIGREGFGYAFGEKGPERVPQLGRVIIQDDVEIGSNTTIDRGALTDTVVGQGTKIDNLVQVGHNVKIGRFCMIAGHCGIAGSVSIGDYVLLGGRAGIADHVKIGSGVQLAAGSAVMEDIPDGARWAGVPAVPVREFFRQVSLLRSMAVRKKGGSDG